MNMKLQNEFPFMTEIAKVNLLLRDKFIEPPFSVLDTKQGEWQDRKRAWLSLGIQSEVGRVDNLTYQGKVSSFDFYRVKEGMRNNTDEQSTSIFDPVLTELMYRWFCPESGNILDPFAGGSVRGIVAHHLGYHYDGIELRQEQVESNREQALGILSLGNQPQWYIGDSNEVLDNEWLIKFDFILSCPPYADLEVYSDLPNDISNMPYLKFLSIYKAIIQKSLALLRAGCFACFVVGEVRDKDGYYYDFVGDTKRAFIDSGAKLYNDAVLLSVVGSASMRASKQFEASKKLVKIHQNVLIFRKL